jgi:hypothetical protein
MKGEGFGPTVSKPDSVCTGNEQLRTLYRSNKLTIIIVVFWHIVDWHMDSQFSHDC